MSCEMCLSDVGQKIGLCSAKAALGREPPSNVGYSISPSHTK